MGRTSGFDLSRIVYGEDCPREPGVLRDESHLGAAGGRAACSLQGVEPHAHSAVSFNVYNKAQCSTHTKVCVCVCVCVCVGLSLLMIGSHLEGLGADRSLRQ